MTIARVFWLAACYTGGAASIAQGASKPVEKTFVSPDAVFRFKYSASLVQCKPEGPDSDSRSCISYFGICEDQGIICLAYPREEYEGYNFSNASFSVSVLEDAKTEAACLNGVDRNYCKPLLVTETHNGVKFRTTDCAEAGLSHGLDDQIYRTFHEQKCYVLSVKIAGTQFATYDPGTIKEFTAADWKKVRQRLLRPVDTFQFRK